LAAIALPVDPHKLVNGMTDSGDAGDFYRAAIRAYEAKKSLYEGDHYDFKSDIDPDAFSHIFAGAKCAKSTLLTANPDQYLGYEDAFLEPLDALHKIENAMGKRGMYLLRTNKAEEARKYFEAVYFLGVKLFDERLVMEELDRGIGAMKDGIYGLHEMALAAKDDNRAAELQRQGDALSDYFRNTFNPLGGLTHDLSSERPGNVFLLAEKGAERVWRVEAIREMGRMKWSVGQSATAADQRGVARMLRHWLAHPPDAHFDDVLRTVAQKALDVSHEDVQNELDVNSQHR
jgi:hypothetical protein